MKKIKTRFDLKTSRLFLALEQRDIDAALGAVNNGEEIDIRDLDGNTPLIRASFLGQPEMVSALLRFSPDVNAVNDLGWTGLHFAAQENNVEIANLLAAAGANIESKDLNGNTPLWRAAFSRSQATSSLLLSLGAKKDMENFHGVKPSEFL